MLAVARLNFDPDAHRCVFLFNPVAAWPAGQALEFLPERIPDVGGWNVLRFRGALLVGQVFLYDARTYRVETRRYSLLVYVEDVECIGVLRGVTALACVEEGKLED